MTDNIAFACVLVNSSDQDTCNAETLTLHNQQNITNVSPTATKGTYEVVFADVFSDYPVVTVTHHFNSGSASNLNKITENVGYGGGYPSDNAVVVFVAQATGGNYYCHVRLGGGQDGNWRSFSLTAMGAAS